MLVAGNLEVLLKQYLRIHGVDVPEKSATLGKLIRILKQKGHLTENGEMHFGQASMQRNYLIHNLYGSFVDEIEKALLPVEKLVPMDVLTYTEKVMQATENLEAYLEIISTAISRSSNVSGNEISNKTLI